jgi:hypothetical protein
VECIDRLYLNVYLPRLQYPAGIVGCVHRQLGLPIASTAPLGKITEGFSAGMRRFAQDQGVPRVDLVKGQRKDDVMHEHLSRFTGEEGCCSSAGRRRKTTPVRTEKRRDRDGVSYPWIVKATGAGNYLVRRDRSRASAHGAENLREGRLLSVHTRGGATAASAGGRDVGVALERVARVVTPFELNEAPPRVRQVGRAHPVGAVVSVELVDVAAAGGQVAQRRP